MAERRPRATPAFIELSKPEITAVVLATVAAGYWAGAGSAIDPRILLLTLLGTGLASGGTAAINMLIEHHEDGRMDRTRRRPIPTGRIRPFHALLFGVTALMAGLLLLAGTVNMLAAALTAITIVLYLFAYTPLKRVSDICILVGSIPGALPPVIGWAAATGSVGTEAGILFLIQFFWQVPHLTAIAWLYKEDYARVGFHLLPAPDPNGFKAARRIVGYGIGLILVSLAPAWLTVLPPLYFTGAVALGFLFFLAMFRFAFDRDRSSARWVFAASMLYLPAILALYALTRRAVP